MTALDPAWNGKRHLVIGMLHLLPLPGAPRFGGNVNAIRDALLRDARALAEGGVHGLMMENFGDVPFFPGRVTPETVEHMRSLTGTVRKEVDLPLGINVLRNDGLSALGIAHDSGASFIRVNVLSGARVTDQGIIQGIAHDLLRERARLGAHNIKIMADVDVKHSAPLAERPLEDEVDDLIERALADAIVVSGAGTGKPTDVDKTRRVKAAARDTPVFIGSGITTETVRQFMDVADGFIVGTALKQDGVAINPVEVERVKRLMAAVNG